MLKHYNKLNTVVNENSLQYDFCIGFLKSANMNHTESHSNCYNDISS